MDTRIINKLHLVFLFLYFVFFPFGQLAKLGGQIFGLEIPHLTDVVVFLNALLFLISSNSPKKINKQLLFPIAVISFSLLYSYFALNLISSRSLFYLFRLGSYVIFSLSAVNLIQKNLVSRKDLLKWLLKSLFAAAVFGWFQYLFFPDLRGLWWLGWDDHLYRLAGAFLDPAFIGILLVVAFFVAKHTRNSLLQFFFLFTLIFTYSRSSFVSLIVAIFFSRGFKIKKLYLFFLLIAILIFSFSSLLGSGEGVNLLRTKSILLKLENFQYGISLFLNSPIFGIGFNNLCLIRHNAGQNSCSGLDNSFLLILVTTGVVGLVAFYHTMKYIYLRTTTDSYGKLFKWVLVAVGVHSLFTNTLFYPYILGILAILITLSRKNDYGR